MTRTTHPNLLTYLTRDPHGFGPLDFGLLLFQLEKYTKYRMNKEKRNPNMAVSAKPVKALITRPMLSIPSRHQLSGISVTSPG